MKLEDILFKQFPKLPNREAMMDWNEKHETIFVIYDLFKFNNILKQPLTLNRLVACKEGKLLDIPNINNFVTVSTGEDFELHEEQMEYWGEAMKQYEEAQKEVWFDGFEYNEILQRATKDYRNYTFEQNYVYVQMAKSGGYNGEVETVGSFNTLHGMIGKDLTPNFWKQFN